MEKQEQSQSIPKGKSAIRGFSIIEVILATALFVLIAIALTNILIYGEQSSASAGTRARAVFLAEEGLEAVRNIKDTSFSNLANGNYGLAVSGSKWIFSGTSDTTGIFTRIINIATVDSSRKTVTCTVTWQQTPQGTGSVVLTTRLTNW